MKALEKAAKDRGEVQQTPAPAVASAAASTVAAAPPPAAKPQTMELTLEPLPASAPPEPAPPRTAAAPRATGRDQAQARAATVLQATASAPSATAGARIRPAMALGIIAAVCVMAIGVYVYLQITNPGLFVAKPPEPKPSTSPLVQAPAAPAAPVATGSVIAPAGTDAPAAPAAPAAPRAAPVAPAAAPVAAQPRDTIRVSAGSAEPQMDPRLSQGYAALQSGKLDAARQFYADAARSEPNSVQALLGLAAIAMQENRTEEASRIYFNVLDLEPRNAYAQSGLIALLGKADPVSAEAKLKQLIAREPMASLYFTLGNLYADQSRWAEAQQAYFQAHHRDPANPDYAYNLAVGLEHVGQSRLAVDFYRRAVAQAATTGRAGFNPAQAQERIRQLAAQPK